MITLKNGCKARNLQEQVAYNTSEITKLKYLVGGAYIEIDDTALTHTGTLTSDMKEVLDAYEVVYVFLKQDDDLYQVFRTDYYEDKFRKSAIIVGSSLHKLDLDYDNSTWSYSEETIVGTTVEANPTGTATESLSKLKVSSTIYSVDAPSSYIKDITNSGNTYTATKQDGTTSISWTIPDISGKLDATKCTFQTTAPSAAISDSGVHIVYLTAEPTTKYDGYIYLIAE